MHGLELRHDAAAPNHRVVLAAVLDAVEQIGEAPGCLCGTDFGHEVRLPDPDRSRSRKPVDMAAVRYFRGSTAGATLAPW